MNLICQVGIVAGEAVVGSRHSRCLVHVAEGGRVQLALGEATAVCDGSGVGTGLVLELEQATE